MLDLRKNFEIKALTLVQGKDDAETPDRALSIGLCAEVTMEEIAELLSSDHGGETLTESLWDQDGDLIFDTTKSTDTEAAVDNLKVNLHIGIDEKPKHQCHAQKLDKLSYRPMFTKGMAEIKFNVLIDGYEDAVYGDLHLAKVKKDLMNIHIVQLETSKTEDEQQDLA